MHVVYRKFATLRKFGVELEVGNEVKKPVICKFIKLKSEKIVHTSRYISSINNSWWHIKDDATCGVGSSKGIEIASFVASGVSDLNHICEVADFLSASGVKVNDNCGLHIHADVSEISESQMGRIIASWIKIETFLSFALPFRRYANPYCEQLTSKILQVFRTDSFGVLNKLIDLIKRDSKSYLDEDVAKEIYQFMRPEDISMYENRDRRVTLNLVNYCRAVHQKNANRKTIELRWPEGTLNGNDIKNWVRLFLNFIEYAKNGPLQRGPCCSSLQEGLNVLGLGHRDNFCILSEGLLTTKIWLLERMLKNPDFEKLRLFAGSPCNQIFDKQDIVKHLNFLCQPVKNYSLENNN